jgi:hypothetical protein
MVQHVLQVHRLSMHGLWTLTRLNYQKVKFLKKKKRIKFQINFFVSDVAFKVGGSTSIKYLVLQVHYSNIDKFQGD